MKIIVIKDENEKNTDIQGCLEVDGLSKGGCLKVTNAEKPLEDLIPSIKSLILTYR